MKLIGLLFVLLALSVPRAFAAKLVVHNLRLPGEKTDHDIVAMIDQNSDFILFLMQRIPTPNCSLADNWSAKWRAPDDWSKYWNDTDVDMYFIGSATPVEAPADTPVASASGVDTSARTSLMHYVGPMPGDPGPGHRLAVVDDSVKPPRRLWADGSLTREDLFLRKLAALALGQLSAKGSDAPVDVPTEVQLYAACKLKAGLFAKRNYRTQQIVLKDQEELSLQNMRLAGDFINALTMIIPAKALAMGAGSAIRAAICTEATEALAGAEALTLIAKGPVVQLLAKKLDGTIVARTLASTEDAVRVGLSLNQPFRLPLSTFAQGAKGLVRIGEEGGASVLGRFMSGEGLNVADSAALKGGLYRYEDFVAKFPGLKPSSEVLPGVLEYRYRLPGHAEELTHLVFKPNMDRQIAELASQAIAKAVKTGQVGRIRVSVPLGAKQLPFEVEVAGADIRVVKSVKLDADSLAAKGGPQPLLTAADMADVQVQVDKLGTNGAPTDLKHFKLLGSGAEGSAYGDGVNVAKVFSNDVKQTLSINGKASVPDQIKAVADLNNNLVAKVVENPSFARKFPGVDLKVSQMRTQVVITPDGRQDLAIMERYYAPATPQNPYGYRTLSELEKTVSVLQRKASTLTSQERQLIKVVTEVKSAFQEASTETSRLTQAKYRLPGGEAAIDVIDRNMENLVVRIGPDGAVTAVWRDPIIIQHLNFNLMMH